MKNARKWPKMFKNLSKTFDFDRDTVEIEIFVTADPGDDGKLVPAVIRKDCISAYWPSISNAYRTYMLIGSVPIEANIEYGELKEKMRDKGFFENIIDPMFDSAAEKREPERENSYG